MSSLEQRINKLLESIEDEFYTKRKKIMQEFEKIERIKKIDYQELRSKLSVLKSSEQRVESMRKGIEKKLRKVMKDAKVLKDKKINAEKKLREINRLSKTYPSLLKKIDSYTEKKKDLLEKKREARGVEQKLENRIESEKKKFNKLRSLLSTLRKGQESMSKKRITTKPKKRKT